ncbi:MAG: zf-HC2 domain-containing protein [Lacunisphaera sp.]|nr:zf-HC2 domain-containing protein [Lacunisphaera sp.]
MNCRDTEPLLLAERDGVLTSEQHAALAGHVAACPACRQFRAALTEATLFLKTDAANVAVPDADLAWRELRAQLQLPGEKDRPAKKRRLAPVIWFGSTLAAAAALTFVFLSRQPRPMPTVILDNDVVAEAEFVEAGDINASMMVYVDKESGWLVVWATDPDSAGKG